MKKDLELVVLGEEAAVKHCASASEIIVVPREVENKKICKILAGAFKGNKAVKFVAIPSTVSEIGEEAFFACENLEVVTSSLKFYDYGDLENADDEELREMFEGEFRSGLFAGEIGARAFKGTGIKSVELATKTSSITIGEEAFSNSGIELFFLENGKEAELGARCFENAKNLLTCIFSTARLTEGTIPEGAFKNCEKLRSFAGAGMISHVGNEAFWGCSSLTAIRMLAPNGVHIGEQAFGGCTNLDLGKYKYRIIPEPRKDGKKEEKAERSRVREIIREVKNVSVLEFEFPVFQAVGTELCGKQVLRGKFLDRSDGVFFKKFTSDEVLFHCEGDCLPLLRYLGQHDVPVNILLVDGQCMGLSLFESSRLSDNLIQVIVLRLQGRSTKHLELVSRADELEKFFEICGNILPDWVKAAYRAERDIMLSNGGGSDYKHALEAVKVLLNIDWAEPRGTHPLPTIAEARGKLDNEYFGMDNVKNRLLTVLAELRRNGGTPPSPVLLYGPPGGGKTTLVEAFSKILGWELDILDLTTTCDIEDLCGSGRIYSNGKIGALLASLLKIRSKNNIVLLVNEIDQAIGERRGIAEVVRGLADRIGYVDNFLQQKIPSDGYLIIATANDPAAISPALLSRFDQVHVPGYKKDEKKHIFDFAFGKALEKKKLNPAQIQVTDEALAELLDCHLLEEGARDVYQAVDRITGDALLHLEEFGEVPVYDTERIKKLFGVGRKIVNTWQLHPGMVEAIVKVGEKAVPCLIEATARPGSGKLEVIGLQGCQKEYVRAGYEAVRCAVGSTVLSQTDITLFSTASISDDGPNQIGLAAFFAIVSALFDVALPPDVVCLGGVDLNGNAYMAADPTPLMAMAARLSRRVIAPRGCKDQADDSSCEGLEIIESSSAAILYELVMAINETNGTPS